MFVQHVLTTTDKRLKNPFTICTNGRYSVKGRQKNQRLAPNRAVVWRASSSNPAYRGNATLARHGGN
jgi:hypothetical protein